VERLRPLLGKLRATSVDQDDSNPIPAGPGTAAASDTGTACGGEDAAAVFRRTGRVGSGAVWVIAMTVSFTGCE